MKKNIIIGVVVGILLTIFSYHAYTVYKLNTRITALENVVAQDTSALQQIVNLINSSAKK